VQRSSRFFRLAGFAVALAFRALPKRSRFRWVVRVARCIEPVIVRTWAYEQRRELPFDGLRETSLDLVLTTLTRHGTTFNPTLRVEGLEHLPQPGVATFLAGAHAMLSTTFLRYLDDIGHDSLIISADPAMRICGTKKRVNTLLPSTRLFFDVRKHLEEGGLIGAMIDRTNPERRNRLFANSRRPLRLSNALLRLALRCGARIVFIAARPGNNSEIVIELDEPSTPVTAEGALVDFADFVLRVTNQGASD
jgi:hypothetical protein